MTSHEKNGNKLKKQGFLVQNFFDMIRQKMHCLAEHNM